jgi:hypothetical protein
MTAPMGAAWLAQLATTQSLALIIALSLALAVLLTWLTQFRRRYAGPSWLLMAFAACGLLVAGLVAATALDLPQATTLATVIALARLTLFTLFCLVASQSHPVSENIEDAL